jgi:hypothetical protein
MKRAPSIASEGSPLERHADRVVDEMIRWPIKENVHFLLPVAVALRTSADGNPKAQERMAGRIRYLGRDVFNGVWLNPGKRGHLYAHARLLDRLAPGTGSANRIRRPPADEQGVARLLAD